MKWTPEGKKIGDKVACQPWTFSEHIEVVEITGESRTQWRSGSFRIRKRDGKCVGLYGVRAFDVDDEVLSVIEQREILKEIKRKHDAIHDWVENTNSDEVIALLWDLVGPKIEGYTPGDWQ